MNNPKLPDGAHGVVMIGGTPDCPRITGQIDFHHMTAEEAGCLFGALVAWCESAAKRLVERVEDTAGPVAAAQPREVSAAGWVACKP